MKLHYRVLGMTVLLVFCLLAWPALADDSGDLAGFYRLDTNEVVQFSPLKSAGWSYVGRMLSYEKQGGRMVLIPKEKYEPIYVRQPDPMTYEWKQGELGKGSLEVTADAVVFKDGKGNSRSFPRMKGLTPDQVTARKPSTEPPLEGVYKMESDESLCFRAGAGGAIVGGFYRFEKRGGGYVFRRMANAGALSCRKVGTQRYKCEMVFQGRKVPLSIVASKGAVYIDEDGKKTKAFARIKGVMPPE